MANVPYDNFVLENTIENMLVTRVDMNNYLTPDYSLTDNPGMIKKIHVYSASGNVQDLAMGEGNSELIQAAYTEAEYEVGVTQGRGAYYDEEQMRDPMIVDTIARGMVDKMANDLTTKAIAELGKATLYELCDFTTITSGYLFNIIADAIANFGEEEEGLFLLASPNTKAYIRKALGDDLKYSEGYVRTGYIGTVCGVPVIISKAILGDTMYLATREAVTAFLKRGVENEADRDPNTRQNFMYVRKVALVALTNATKVVKIVKSAPEAPTATIAPESATVAVGAKLKVSSAGPAGVIGVYSTNDAAIATVQPDGTVKGIAEGEATITVTYTVDGQDYTADSAITVSNSNG